MNNISERVIEIIHDLDEFAKTLTPLQVKDLAMIEEDLMWLVRDIEKYEVETPMGNPSRR